METKPKSQINRERSEYRKTHPNGRVLGFIDEHDRAIIKAYCKMNDLTAAVDLSKNSCTITSKVLDKNIFIGTVQKVVYKDTFILLSPFKFYTNRDRKPGEPKSSVVLKPGVEMFVDSNDKNKIWVPVGENYLLIPRFIVSTSTSIRQKIGLYIINIEDGIGIDERWLKTIDMVSVVNKHLLVNKTICTI